MNVLRTIRAFMILFVLIVAVSSIAFGAGATDGVSDDEKINRLTTWNKAQRVAAEAAAKELLKKPIGLPVPPSVTLKCHHETEDKDEVVLKQFMEEFNKPEGPVLVSLLKTSHDAQLLGADFDGTYRYELRLLDRLWRKASMLMDTYMGQEDRYIPVVRAALTAEKGYRLLAPPDDGSVSLLPKAAKWAQMVADKFLKELVDKHEYANIHPIGKVVKEAGLLGADMDGYLGKLDKATTFRLEFDLRINPGRKDAYEFGVMGRAYVNILGINASGTGSADYTGFKVNSDGIQATMENMPNTFTIHAGVTDFLPCGSNTFGVTLDRFGAQAETITITIPGEPDVPPKTTTTRGFVQKVATDSFADMLKDGVFRFNLNLLNGQVVAAEQSFTGTARTNGAELTLRLVHKPQK